MDNGDSGIIFIHKKCPETIDFFLMSETRGYFIPDIPKDSVSQFKRNNNLEAYGYMISVSSK